MWNYRKTFLLLFIFTSIQSYSFVIKAFQVNHYTTINGLPSNCIKGYFKDSNDTYWLATNCGLTKLGANFDVFTINEGLPGNQISCITNFTDDYLCIGTEYNGLALYDGVTFTVLDKTKGLPNNCIKNLFYSQSKKELYVVTDGWLSIYDGKSFKNIKLSTEQNQISQFAHTETTLYFVTVDQKSYHYHSNKEQLEPNTIREFNFIKNTEKTVQAETFHNSTDFGFIANQKDSLAKLLNVEIDDISFINYNSLDKSYLVGTLTNGLYILTPKVFSQHEIKCSDPNNQYIAINTSLNDQVMMVGDCIKYINPDNTQASLPCNTMKCKKQNQHIQQIDIRHNKTIYRSNNSLYYYNRYENTEIKIASDSCCFFYWAEHFLVAKYTNTFDVFNYPKLDLQGTTTMPSSIKQIIGNGQILYISTEKNGLYTYNIIDKQLIHLNKSYPFIPENISNILVDKKQNLIIIDNNDSIHLVSMQKKELQLLEKWYPLKFQRSLSIRWAMIDNQNNIWLASNQSLHQIELNNYYNHSKKSIKSWNECDGYIGQNSLGAIEAKNGHIYILYPQNLLMFNPIELHQLERNPKLILSKISYQNGSKTIVHSNSTYKNQHKTDDGMTAFKFKHNENTLQFDFTPVNTVCKDHLVYRYKLTPDTQGWSNVSQSSIVTFSNLKPGNYNLKIEAFFIHSPEKKHTIEYSLTITAPWYSNYYAYIAYAVLLFLLTVMIINIRIDQIRRNDEHNVQTRERMALLKMEALQSQMNPHFIFNAMNSLQYSILENNTEKALEFIGEFSTLIRSTLENASQQYISIKDEVDYIENYLRVEQMRYYKNFQYSINISADINQLKFKIPPMLLQPHIENAIKYSISSSACYIIISLSKMHDKLVCMIEDNGIGRSHSSKLKKNHQSKSQSITKERFENLNLYYNKNNEYRFEIEDLYDANNHSSGTRVTVFFPLVIDKQSNDEHND